MFEPRFMFPLVASLAACASHPSARPVTPAAPPAKTPVELSIELPQELPPREELPEEAREMLSGRMLRHGSHMTVLMATVVLLNYEATYVLAEDLAEEPKLGRPAPGEKGTLNALLPASFFEHQDALTTHARSLAAAARERDDGKLVDAFAAVAKTCVGCHAVYLNDELEPPEHEEPADPTLCDPGDSCADGATGARGRGLLTN